MKVSLRACAFARPALRAGNEFLRNSSVLTHRSSEPERNVSWVFFKSGDLCVRGKQPLRQPAAATSPYTGEAFVRLYSGSDDLRVRGKQPLRQPAADTSPYTGEAFVRLYSGFGGRCIRGKQPLRQPAAATSPYTGEAFVRLYSGFGGVCIRRKQPLRQPEADTSPYTGEAFVRLYSGFGGGRRLCKAPKGPRSLSLAMTSETRQCLHALSQMTLPFSTCIKRRGSSPVWPGTTAKPKPS